MGLIPRARGVIQLLAGIVLGIVLLFLGVLMFRNGNAVFGGGLFVLFVIVTYFVNERRKNLYVVRYEGERR